MAAARPTVWIPFAVLAAVVPVLIDYALGTGGSHLLTALLVAPLLIGAVVRDATRRGVALLLLTFLAHSIVAITIAARAPDRFSAMMGPGIDYWEESLRWIVSGESREYELNWWLPAHVQLLGAVALFSYLSLGFVTIWEGLYQVDLMNAYVGQLMSHSQSPTLAVAVGWHAWSVCRGIGFLLITYEVVSLSFERLTASQLSTSRRRRLRWLAGVTFLLLDAILKYTFLEDVRSILAANLLVS